MFTPAVTILPHVSNTRSTLFSHVILRLRTHLAGITAAHARLVRLSRITGADSRDTRLSPEDLLGEPDHDPALPFFLQRGFDRH